MSASPTASDVSGNLLVAKTPSYAQGQVTIAVDTTPPTAKLQSSGHSFDTVNDAITLSVSNVGTLGVLDGESLKSQLDWSKLVWNAVGDTSSSMTFSSDDISTAVVDLTSETILVTLTEGVGLGETKLYAFSSFGGVGSNIDNVQASAGFLNDAAGNTSSEEAAVTTVDVSMADTTAPVIKSISAVGPSGATLVGKDDIVTFTAVMTDANEIKADTKFYINLDDGLGIVELTRTTSTATDELTGQYTVQAGDNSSGLSLLNFNIPPSEFGARDISGNQLEGGASVVLTNDDVIVVDTTGPAALVAHTFVSDKLTIFLSEVITSESRTDLENALQDLTGVNEVDSSYTSTLGIRFSIDGSFTQTEIDITGANVSLEDTYGNNTLITTIEVI